MSDILTEAREGVLSCRPEISHKVNALYAAVLRTIATINPDQSRPLPATASFRLPAPPIPPPYANAATTTEIRRLWSVGSAHQPVNVFDSTHFIVGSQYCFLISFGTSALILSSPVIYNH
jgi:hypothetical protein